MIYVYGYLLIGVGTLVVLFVSNKLRSKPESESLRAILEASNPDRKLLSYKIINNVLVPGLASVFVVIAWPVAWYMKIKGLDDKAPGEDFQEKVFAVAKSDLLMKMTAEQIESAEIVVDPMNAVPAQPSGHLNRCWLDFLAKRQPGDELWSFKSCWDEGWGPSEIRAGYVLVREGSPDAHILTELVPVETKDTA